MHGQEELPLKKGLFACTRRPALEKGSVSMYKKKSHPTSCLAPETMHSDQEFKQGREKEKEEQARKREGKREGW